MVIEVRQGFDCCKKTPCSRDDGFNSWELSDGTVLKTCPARLINRESIMWFSWFDHYQKGVLPVAGGLLDQTAVYVDVMGIIAGERING